MNEMYKRIEELCKKRGVNVTQMCRDTGIPRGNLTDLKMNRTVELSTKALGKIAVYFDVSMDHLLGHEKTKNTLTTPQGDKRTELQQAVVNKIMSWSDEELKAFAKIIGVE